jgi:hypothetical protein
VDDPEQVGELAGLVFEVGVLDHDDLRGGVPEPGNDRGPLAPVSGMMDHRQARVPGRGGVQGFRRPVGRAVVDDDHLRHDGNRLHRLQHGADRCHFIIDGYNCR